MKDSFRPIADVHKQIRRIVSGLVEGSVVLMEDETDLLLFPPLRAMWARRDESACVMLSGRNAKRVVFGCMNLVTGRRLFLVREKQYATDFQAFLREVWRHYGRMCVVMLLDGDRSHTAKASQALAKRLKIQLLWLPTRSPELNPMDTLWGQAKDAVCVNTQYVTIAEQTGCVHCARERLVESAGVANLWRVVGTFLVEMGTVKKLLRTYLVPIWRNLFGLHSCVFGKMV